MGSAHSTCPIADHQVSLWLVYRRRKNIYVGEIKAGTVYVYLERATMPVQV